MLHLVLLLASVAHWGSETKTQGPPAEHPAYVMVYVKTCDGKWENIYKDSEMTVPSANPLLSDQNGNYEYYSVSSLENVTIYSMEGQVFTLNTCKTRNNQ